MEIADWTFEHEHQVAEMTLHASSDQRPLITITQKCRNTCKEGDGREGGEAFTAFGEGRAALSAKKITERRNNPRTDTQGQSS